MRINHVLFLLACLGSSMPSISQTKSAASGIEPPADHVPTIRVGQSVIPLFGPWKFHTGDSPIAPGSGGFLWAAPDFDDSTWETVDLTPPARNAGAALEASVSAQVSVSGSALGSIPGYVPGWEARGHQGYSGYAWYRMRVRVTNDAGTHLAVQGPSAFDNAYQFFQNGTLSGSFGIFHADGSPPAYFTSQGKVFDCCYQVNLAKTSAAPTTFAFRVWMDQASMGLESGGFHSPPLIGNAPTLHSFDRLAQFDRFRLVAGTFSLTFCYLLLAVVVCGLSFLDRSDPVYRWLAFVFLVLVFGSAVTVIASSTQMLTDKVDNFLIALGFYPPWLFGWMMVWWFWFRPRNALWLRWAIVWLSLLFMLCNGIRLLELYRQVPHTLAIPFRTLSLLLRGFALLLLLFIVIRGKKPRGAERWLLFPALSSTVLGTFDTDLYLAGIPEFFTFLGFRVFLIEVANGLAVLAMTILMINRLLLSLRNQRAMNIDVKQAQEVQRVLLPESLSVPGLKIEVEYRPAREVGGDFFQVIPDETDGSVLIVAGDVTGKGLSAGMLVAVLVGAIRSTGETTSDPRRMLEALNRRLLGRSEAFATCLVLRIETSGVSQGQVTLANAGHLPPYLDGVEVLMDGALPLGMVPDPEFPIATFRMNSGQTLTVISDGILEAENQAGELFGFERVREMMSAGATVMSLANAAQNFGQNDDISAISITWA